MAIILSPFVIFGLAAGGALLFVIVGATTAIMIGRRKHKRSLMLMNARGARRLSGYPGGHVSMSDYEWLSMPRTRTLRSSTRVPTGYPRSYTPITSRESLPRHQTMMRPPRALVSESHLPDPTVQQASWPLPPRLTRSNVLPLAHVRGQNMSPVVKQTSVKLVNASPSPNNAPAQGSQVSPKHGAQRGHDVLLPTGIPLESPRSNISSNTAQALTPKPLFHDKQRSASLGTLPQIIDRSNQSGLYVVDSKAADAQQGRLPRSTSLCAQTAAMAPNEPLPPLPLHVTKLRSFHSIRSPTEHRGSENSLLSGDTSILDNRGSKQFSQAETDLTSISKVSPKKWGSVGLGILDDDDAQWSSTDIIRTASPLEAVKQANIRPQLKAQSSYRASIQHSLPRSGSSGLSLSLLDKSPFRHPLSQTHHKDNPIRSDEQKLNTNRGLIFKQSQRGASPSSPLTRKSMINIYEDSKAKRSLAVLQDVSGNQGSPLHDGVKSRPLSVATSNPFEWETEKHLKPGKPSAMKGRARGHKRNSCVRISNIPVYIPSPNSLQPTSEEPEEPVKKPSTAAASAFIFGKSMQNPPPLRPPSRLTFDPQLTPTPKPRSTRLPQRTSITDDSPTFSLLNLHNPSDTVSPTPNRTIRSLSGANPNRRKPIFEAPAAPDFTFSTPEKPDPEQRESAAPDLLLQATADVGLSPMIVPKRLCTPGEHNDEEEREREDLVPRQANPKPSSNIFPFPSPPHPHPHGPRALPPSAWRRRSSSRSPTRIPKGNLSGSWTCAGSRRVSRGSKDLRKSVMALRRMNSEAQQGLAYQKRVEDSRAREGGGKGEKRDGNSGESAKGHKRYLSLGDQGSDAGIEDEGHQILASIAGGGSSPTTGRGGRKRERERSESSLAFERVLGGPGDMGAGTDTGGNVFAMTDGLPKTQRDAEQFELNWAHETPGSLYDENGFLRGSPARRVGVFR